MSRASRALRAAVLLALPPALLSAAPAQAADDSVFLPTVLNFLLLVGVLFYLLRKPVKSYFHERRESIRRDIDEAADLKRQAEERFGQWQRRLADLEQELEDIRTTARERAEAERDSLLADARAAAERIRRDAASAVDQELRRARARLRDEASELAVELAAGMLREQVNEGDRARLLDEFIERIEHAPGTER